jgi:hypothetical protein
MNRSISLTSSLFVLLCVNLEVASAVEQRIEYETDTEKYTAWFDDARIPVAEMQRLVWLSPNLPPDLPGPFLMVSSYRDDKELVVPTLEECVLHKELCGDGASNAMLLKNAQLNLQQGTEQIEKLKNEEVPPALQSVKSYLLQTIQFRWDLQNARYLYAQNGNTRLMEKILCKQCVCDGQTTTLLQQLQTNPDDSVSLRLLRTFPWYRHVNRCHLDRDKYPVSAWDQFKREFGIREELHHKHID